MCILLILVLFITCVDGSPWNSPKAPSPNDSVFLPRKRPNLWQNASVYYTFLEPSNATAKDEVRYAMRHIENQTCIRFIEVEDVDNVDDFVVIFTLEEDCSVSHVGRRGGSQKLLIANYCTRMHILHELMHIIGFHHEFQRPDRDVYVSFNVSNIPKEVIDNKDLIGGLEKIPQQEYRSFGDCFDFESVTNMGEHFFAVDSRYRTILPILECAKIQNDGKLSETDVERVNLLYNCTDIM